MGKTLSARQIDAVFAVDAPRPDALLSLARQDRAVALMLEGLRQHYIDCLAAGRLDEWAAAGHGVITLMATDPPGLARARRSEIGDGPEEGRDNAI